jgi:hypothetical protein
MTSRVLASALLLVTIAAHASAQTRPLLTEEAATGPKGRLVLEAGAGVIAAEPNFQTGRERTRADLPVLDLIWSPADNVELDVEWVSAVVELHDPDFGTRADLGDVTLRAKVRLLQERPRRPALAARFAVMLPQTSFGKGLGPDTLRMSADLLLGGTLGRVSLHANAGLATVDVPVKVHEQSDFFAYGLSACARVGSRTALVIETAGRTGDPDFGAADHAEARAGVRFGSGRLRWDAAVRRGLRKADGGWGMTAGVSWAIRE